MLPRLQAEESLRAVVEGAMAGGQMKPADRQKQIRAWQRESRGNDGPGRAPTAFERETYLAMNGIAVLGISEEEFERNIRESAPEDESAYAGLVSAKEIMERGLVTLPEPSESDGA